MPSPSKSCYKGVSGSGADRAVDLVWDPPDTGLTIIDYAVYRNGTETGRTTSTGFRCEIGKNNYDFYVTAVYTDDIESGPSNIVNTGRDSDLPPVVPDDGGTKTPEEQESDEES
jgi:hypothetical protein